MKESRKIRSKENEGKTVNEKRKKLTDGRKREERKKKKGRKK